MCDIHVSLMIYCDVIIKVGLNATAWAANFNHIDCLKLLVDCGGDINDRCNVSDMLVMTLSVTPPPAKLEIMHFIFFSLPFQR